MGRNDKCFCGSGKKTKKCHYTVKETSKLAEIYKANVNFDLKVKNSNIHANCPVNCSSCCNDFFFVSENEFLLILDSIQRKGGKTLIETYQQKAEEYQSYLEVYYPDIMNMLDSFMPQGNREDTRIYFNDQFQWDRSKSCIFLENGKCTIYEDRPHICRMYGVCQCCPIINNEPYHFQEEVDLALTDLIKGERAILKRPYPLFYYFSFFLKQPYYDSIMQKLTMIRTKTEKEYAEFCEQIQM